MSVTASLVRILRLSVFLLIGSAAQASSASALVFYVNDSSNSPDYEINGVCEVEPGTHACSLRAALDEINAAGGSQMHFVFIDARTIGATDEVNSNFLSISTGLRVTIWGAGPTRTKIYPGYYRSGPIFTIADSATLVLHGVSVVNAYGGALGGAVVNSGTLVIDASGFSDDVAALSKPSGNGGALYNAPTGRAVILASTFEGNGSRAAGGAIRNDGWLAVSSTTFARNQASGGFGGALYNLGTAYIVGSTFSGNTGVGGGAIANSGTITIVNTTFASNATIANPAVTLVNLDGGKMQLLNSLLVADAAPNCVGTIQSIGFNMANDDSCGLSSNGDWQNLDPLLGPLADHGGPTQTHALLPGSFAIDRGWCVRGFDQRGYPRPVDMPDVPNAANACDIGAFELQRWERR